MNRKQANMILFMLFSAVSNNSHAGWQSLNSVTLQTEAFLETYPYQSPYPPGIEVSQLDQRLKLKSCHQALTIKFSQSQKTRGNTSVAVSCKSPVKWQLHLPVRIDIYDDIAVNKKAILKGQTIDISNIRYQKKNITDLRSGFFRKSDAIERLQAKRNLPPYSILNSTNIAPELLVKSGQQVTIILEIEGLKIKSTGKALQSASLGQLVKVRNTQSNKIIEGTVSSEGQVKITL